MKKLAIACLVIAACSTKPKAQTTASSSSSSTGGSSSTTTGGDGGTTGGTSSGTSTGGAPLTKDAFLDQLTTIYCTDNLPGCCSYDGFTFNASTCATYVTNPYAKIGANATFSLTAAQACLDATTASLANCLVDATAQAACKKQVVFVGSVAPGGACLDDTDCAPQSDGQALCNGAGYGGTGFCVLEMTSTTVGAACFQNAGPAQPMTTDCGSGLFCNSSQQCQSDIADGQHCTASTPCVSGDYCDYDSGYCAPQVGAGADCPIGIECKDGFGCDLSTNKCVAQLPTGSACDPDALYQCVNSDECDSTVKTCLSIDAADTSQSCGD